MSETPFQSFKLDDFYSLDHGQHKRLIELNGMDFVRRVCLPGMDLVLVNRLYLVCLEWLAVVAKSLEAVVVGTMAVRAGSFVAVGNFDVVETMAVRVGMMAVLVV